MYAGENKTPDIDGKNNGSSLKYNQNCLDIAYKNAYGNASGKPTSSSDFKNYKCYINGKVVPCTSMSEDGQTKKAEADYQNYLFANTRAVEGKVTIDAGNGLLNPNRKIYGATWWADDNGVMTLRPENSIYSIYYEPARKQFRIDISAELMTMRNQYPHGQAGKNMVTDKPLTVTINGKSLELTNYAYHTQDTLGESSVGIVSPQGEFYFYDGKNQGDVFGFADLVGQTIDISLSW